MNELGLFSQADLAVGLAMDAFAVAISMGATLRTIRLTQLLRLAIAFGGFQGLMVVVGYLAGRALSENLWVTTFDHWVAFGLLAFLGGKMIYEARYLPEESAPQTSLDPTKSMTLVFLAIVTSIDALAVGASLAFLRVTIVSPSLVIGLTAAVFAVVGALLGQRFGQRWGKKVEVAGGLALIAIGLRILVDHLLHPATNAGTLPAGLGLF